jgi:hypothetical protein
MCLGTVEKRKIWPLQRLKLRPFPTPLLFTGDHKYLRSGNELKIINVTNKKYQNYWSNMREAEMLLVEIITVIAENWIKIPVLRAEYYLQNREYFSFWVTDREKERDNINSQIKVRVLQP